MDLIRDSIIYKKYVEQCYIAARYAKENLIMPDKERINYNNALIDYRIFLDRNEFKMPVAKYPYDPKDKKTWKWLDNKQLKFGKVNNLNANWIYYTSKGKR